jgi:hypothetical protein
MDAGIDRAQTSAAQGIGLTACKFFHEDGLWTWVTQFWFWSIINLPVRIAAGADTGWRIRYTLWRKVAHTGVVPLHFVIIGLLTVVEAPSSALVRSTEALRPDDLRPRARARGYEQKHQKASGISDVCGHP